MSIFTDRIFGYANQGNSVFSGRLNSRVYGAGSFCENEISSVFWNESTQTVIQRKAASEIRVLLNATLTSPNNYSIEYQWESDVTDVYGPFTIAFGSMQMALFRLYLEPGILSGWDSNSNLLSLPFTTPPNSYFLRRGKWKFDISSEWHGDVTANNLLVLQTGDNQPSTINYLIGDGTRDDSISWTLWPNGFTPGLFCAFSVSGSRRTLPQGLASSMEMEIIGTHTFS
jgi:hypothetical protein